MPRHQGTEGRRGRQTARGKPGKGKAPAPDTAVPRRKRSRKATEEAILRAAERVFSRRGFDGVTVRDVADCAGVTHALVHRYFGTKIDLYKAVLARNENVIRDAATGVDQLTEAATVMIREGLAHHREYLRLLVASSLRGIPFDRSIASFGATERLIELARPAAAYAVPKGAAGDEAMPTAAAEADTRLAIAMAVALYLGWVAMEPWLVKATHIDDLGEESRVAGLERAVTILLDGWLAPPAGSGQT
jgi:AcrR family transcriptional regulator